MATIEKCYCADCKRRITTVRGFTGVRIICGKCFGGVERKGVPVFQQQPSATEVADAEIGVA